MSVKTFIDWWFGWASRMKIDFRTPCDACDGIPKVLACDGTKIGIAFKSMFVDSIETVSDDVDVIETPSRRNDRSFLKGDKTAKLLLKKVCSSILRSDDVADEQCVTLSRLLPNEALGFLSPDDR